MSFHQYPSSSASNTPHSNSHNNMHSNTINGHKRPSLHRRSPSPYRNSTIPPPTHLFPLAASDPAASASSSHFVPNLETRVFMLESLLAAAASKTEHDTHRFSAIEAHLQRLQNGIDAQNHRLQALEQRIEAVAHDSAQSADQMFLQLNSTDTRAAVLNRDLEQLKLNLGSASANVASHNEQMAKLANVVFVMSEQSRKLDEKLRACEHQRIKAEAFLRTLSHSALTLQGYNALVDAGLHKLPELQQRIATNKKDLLASMAPRMKQDYKIDVIDENTGQIRTPLFPRPSHPSANERAAALAAKAEAEEVMFLRQSQGAPM